MQFNSLLLGSLLAASALAIPADSSLSERAVCKKPKCTAYCPDKTPYDCCVVYIRDPCADHQLCYCPDKVTTYICNAEYLVDPCKSVTATA